MEIGQQAIDYLEIKSGGDEKGGFLDCPPQFTMINSLRASFERASKARWCQRLYPPSACAALCDSIDSFFGNMIVLGVHHMFFNRFGFHWLKCARTNMQGNIGNVNTLLPQACQHGFIEVQPGGGEPPLRRSREQIQSDNYSLSIVFAVRSI